MKVNSKGENGAYFDKVDITQFKANNEQNVSLKKKQYLLRFSVHVILFELPLPLPILMMSFNNNKKMWTYISSEEIVKWKQVLRPCLFLLQRKKYFNFFIQLTQRKKNLSSDTFCQARSAKLPNYTFMNEENAGMHQLSCIK